MLPPKCGSVCAAFMAASVSAPPAKVERRGGSGGGADASTADTLPDAAAMAPLPALATCAATCAGFIFTIVEGAASERDRNEGKKLPLPPPPLTVAVKPPAFTV